MKMRDLYFVKCISKQELVCYKHPKHVDLIGVPHKYNHPTQYVYIQICIHPLTAYLLTQLAGMPCKANSVNWRWSVVPEASLLLFTSTASPSVTWGNGGEWKEEDGEEKERR